MARKSFSVLMFWELRRLSASVKWLISSQRPDENSSIQNAHFLALASVAPGKPMVTAHPALFGCFDHIYYWHVGKLRHDCFRIMNFHNLKANRDLNRCVGWEFWFLIKQVFASKLPTLIILSSSNGVRRAASVNGVPSFSSVTFFFRKRAKDIFFFTFFADVYPACSWDVTVWEVTTYYSAFFLGNSCWAAVLPQPFSKR